MSEITKAARTAINKPDSELGTAFSNALVTAGGSGVAAMLIAGLLPFVTLPMVIVAMLVAGIYLKIK